MIEYRKTVIQSLVQTENDLKHKKQGEEADAKIKARRHQLIRELQVLQDTYTKAGKLDEAVGIRDRIQQLKAQSKPETKD